MAETKQLWTCTCYPGWISSGNTIGHYCDSSTANPSDPNSGHAAACTPNPCQHGGTCSATMMLGVAMAACQCPSAYGGVHCETQDTVNGQTSTAHCAAAATANGGAACLNGGSCMDLFGQYQCQCLTGYGGTDCEQHDSVNDCTAGVDPCHGQGTCADIFFGFTCTCYSGYGGADCPQIESQ